MYGNSVKQMKVKFIVSFVLGIIGAVVAMVINISMPYNHLSVLAVLGISFLAVLLFPFEVMAFVLNWKKIFLGLIKPIPILSFWLQYFVGLFMSFKAFIWLLKHWKDKE